MKKVYVRETFLLSLIAGVSIGIMINCAGLFYMPVASDLGILQGSYALTGTISLVISACISFFIPRLLYTFPVKQLVLAGALLMSLATAACAFSSSLMVFYLLAVIRGLGMGLLSNTMLTSVISNWFYEKSSLITSIVMSFAGLFGALLSPVFGSCITLFGWRMTHLIMAAVTFLLILPCQLLPFRAFPLDMSEYPYGFKEEEEQDLVSQSFNCRLSFHSGLFICLVIMAASCTLITGIGQYISGFGLDNGLSMSASSSLLSIALTGNIVGKLLIGVIAGKLGPIKASLVMSLMNVLGLCLLMICPLMNSLILYYAAAFLYGAIYSLSGVSTSMVTRHFYGPVLYVKAFSVIGFVVTLMGAFSLPLVGYVYDFFHNYQIIFYGGLALNLIFAASLLMAGLKASQQLKTTPSQPVME